MKKITTILFICTTSLLPAATGDEYCLKPNGVIMHYRNGVAVDSFPGQLRLYQIDNDSTLDKQERGELKLFLKDLKPCK